MLCSKIFVLSYNMIRSHFLSAFVVKTGPVKTSEDARMSFKLADAHSIAHCRVLPWSISEAYIQRYDDQNRSLSIQS